MCNSVSTALYSLVSPRDVLSRMTVLCQLATNSSAAGLGVSQRWSSTTVPSDNQRCGVL